MTALAIVIALVVGVVVFVRARRRAGASVIRSFTVEPPAGRLGKAKRSRL